MSALQRTASVMDKSYNPQDDIFDPEALANGDLSQLDNWISGENSRIFVNGIPDWFTDYDARKVFTQFGPVTNVEFVSKITKGRKIERMMSVHFEQFYDQTFSREVAHAHPKPFSVMYYNTNTMHSSGNLELKCCIDMSRTSKVDYTVSQLSDMFEHLNTSTKDELNAMRKEIAMLKEENKFLRTDIQAHKAMISMMPMTIENMHIITSDPADVTAKSVENMMKK